MEEQSLAAYLFHQGTNFRAQEYLGLHAQGDKIACRVWAPRATAAFLVGDFNGWREDNPLDRITEGGIFEGTVPKEQFPQGSLYKFKLKTPTGDLYKADPYARRSALPPETASVYEESPDYAWHDAGWLTYRAHTAGTRLYAQPVNIYEMHLGSFRRHEDGSPLTYRELAEELPCYLKQMGYTHVEFLPVMEHPFDGSWGYQICGFFAPTARFGAPCDFMALVDALHEAGIGVILDWVPAHFPKDAHGLYEFDGGPLYEYQGADRMEHRGWGTRCFDVGREEVQCFLISNAAYWAQVFHADGLRVDAVASMLYLDYDREPGEWIPNIYGDNRNLEAMAFFRKLNGIMHRQFPDVMMIAEESTAWGNLTSFRDGGLGFSLKWNMGWMNDTLAYAAADPLFRKGMHGNVTFSLTYAFGEKYVLPISHDEVVHGKKSLLDRMPGSYEEKFAGTRVFLAWQMTHPGKKLLFMGCEIGQFREWDYAGAIEWFLLGYESHAKLQHYVSALNHFYLSHPPLYEIDDSFDGFTWIDANNNEQSVLAFRRTDRSGKTLVILLNFTPVKRECFRVGMPLRGIWQEVFNSDLTEYGGGGTVNEGDLRTEDVPMHGLPQSLSLSLPPLGALFLSCRRRFPEKKNGRRSVLHNKGSEE